KPNTCATPDLPAPIPTVLNVGVACSSASASVVNGNPVAASTASVANVAASANTILQQLNAVTTPIGSTLDGLLDSVCTNLQPTCTATTTVSDLVTSVLNTQTLDVAVGPSSSSVTTEASKVTSVGQAAGAV